MQGFSSGGIMKLQTIISVLAAVVSIQASALEFDTDVPSNIQAQMIEDLKFMTTVKGSHQTPFHQKVFTSLSGASYKNFFETRVLSVA
jgi:hypothetical protein